jgi:hypothetical protein
MEFVIWQVASATGSNVPGWWLYGDVWESLSQCGPTDFELAAVCLYVVLQDALQNWVGIVQPCTHNRTTDCLGHVISRRSTEVIRDTLFPFHVTDNRLYRMTVWSMEKRRDHCQASTFSSDFDDVSFPCSNRSKLCFTFWVSPEQYRVDTANMITQ